MFEKKNKTKQNKKKHGSAHHTEMFMDFFISQEVSICYVNTVYV